MFHESGKCLCRSVRRRRTAPRATTPARGPGLGLALGLAVTGWAGVAAAMPGCEGTYVATLLKPLPAHIVVGLEAHERSPAVQKLADRFLEGIRTAGVAVGPQPSVVLHVSTSLLGGPSDGSGGSEERSYSDMSGLNGGIPTGMPLMPSTRLTAPRTPPAAPLLFLRVDATEGQETRVSWVASVQCRLTGTDDGERAEQMGRVVGGTLGQRVDRRPL